MQCERLDQTRIMTKNKNQVSLALIVSASLWTKDKTHPTHGTWLAKPKFART